MGDALLTTARRLAEPLGIDPERVRTTVERLDRGYARGLRWRACVWVDRPGRAWCIEDALRVGDEIAVDVRGVDPEDATRRALAALRQRIEGRRDEARSVARRATIDADVYQRALDALDALSASSKGGDRG